MLDRVSERTLHLLVIGGCLLLYVPLCGAYGLWDPWESHYAEVARQITLRGDWISLYWPCSPLDPDEFWSKPALTFWAEALSLKLFGLGGPGAPASQMALSAATEWAIRLPSVLFGVLGVWGVFYAALRLVSRRAALLSAVVCATSPMYFLLSRQAMTDMPMVGPMTAAICLTAVALLGEDAELPRGRFPRSPLFAVLLGLFAILTVPQLVLFSLPRPPGLDQMAPYALVAVWFVLRASRATHRSQLLFFVACLLCGLAMLAKGLAGVGLPGLVVLLFVALTKSWRRLLRLDLLTGALCFVAVALPWYHAMLAIHGEAYWDDFFGDNHWRRFVVGRHGDKSGEFTYYIRELGYALFPWTPVALVAAPAGLRRNRPVLLLAALWAALAYAVMTFSATKFHHYILPAIPAIALLCGCFLDSLLDGEVPASAVATTLLLFAVPLAGFVLRDLVVTPAAAQRLLWLFDYDYASSGGGLPWPEQRDYSLWLLGLGAASLLAAAGLALPSLRRAATAGLCACALAFTVFTIDKFLVELAPHWSEKHLLATYFRTRAPGERLALFRVYSRGDSFYSSNEPYDPALPFDERSVFFGERDVALMKAWLRRHASQRVFVLFWRDKMDDLLEALPPATRRTFRLADTSHNKVLLATVTATP